MKDPRGSFYSDRKWCAACDAYVPYLMSLDTSYCAECGGEVRLFSREDWEDISDQLKARRPGSRRRRSQRGGDSAARRVDADRDSA